MDNAKPQRGLFVTMLVVSVVVHAGLIAFVTPPSTQAELPPDGILITMVAEVPEAVVEEPAEPEPEKEQTPEIADVPEVISPVVAQPVSDEVLEVFDEEAIPDVVELTAPVVLSSEPPSEPAEVVKTAAANSQLILTYEQKLAAWLSRHKQYPSLALRRGSEGECVLRITIERNGTVADYELVDSTGHGILDREAKAMVQRANPFPAAPDELSGDVHTYEIPVSFRLTN